MKSAIMVSTVVFLIFTAAGSVLAATPGDIRALQDFALKNIFPQQGPGGGAMFVLTAEKLPRPYGYENVFFRVHDGGSRFYVTMFRKEIHLQRDGGKIVLAVKFVDGGSIVTNNDDFGPSDGRPDRVVFNAWRISAEGEILEEVPENFIDLEPGTELYEKYLKLFDEGLTVIKRTYGLK